MKVFLEHFCVFLRNVFFHEENGFMCIVRRLGQFNSRNAVFLTIVDFILSLYETLAHSLCCRDLFGRSKHNVF